jgi:uncharacterized protein (TIGR02246 family)
MRRFLVRIAAVVLSLVVIQSAAPSNRTADESAVREVVARYMDAREKRDARALEALFTDDADQMTTGGEWRRGRNNVVQGAQASSERNPGARRIVVEAVRFVAADVALADGRYEVGTERNRTTLVLTRGADGWRIAAIRNMAPANGRPPAPR